LKFFQRKIYYGWIIVAAAFLCLVLTGGLRYAFGVFFTPICKEFGWTRTMTSGVFSLYMAFYAIGAPITGRIVDKYGPKVLIISGACLLGLGMLGCSMTSKIWQLYLFYGVLIGLGSAATGWVCLISTVSQWFIKKRGIVTGITGAGVGLGIAIFAPLTADIFGRTFLGTLWGIITISNGIGGAIGPLFAGWVYDTFASYCPAFITGSIVSIIASILFALLVKPMKSPIKAGLEDKIQD